MGLQASTARVLRHAGIDLTEDADLAKRTWWRVGGPADGFATVRTIEELATVQRVCDADGVPVFVLGNGSNLLISDAGIRGAVVRLAGDLASISLTEDKKQRVLVVGGGVKLARFVSKAVDGGWSGMEVFAGIPGTLGGAVRMNAGARLGETVDVLLDVDVVHKDGTVSTLDVTELSMSYRSCTLPPGAIVASARLKITDADPTPTFARMSEFLARRKATQPVDMRSCGSTFRNPPGDHAGRLIEAAGLKGFEIGGARVSMKHANFVVNTGDATADELRAVIEHMAREVQSQFGVALQREVHFVGDWSHWKAA